MTVPVVDTSASKAKSQSASAEEMATETTPVDVKIEASDGVRKSPKKLESVPLTPYDNYYLRLTRPEYFLNICSFMWLEGNMTPETALEVVTQLSMWDAKFRRRVVRGNFWRVGRWVEMDTVTETVVDEETGETRQIEHPWSPKDHLVVHELDTSALEGLPEEEREERERKMIEQEFCNYVEEPFDENLPLWRVVLIRGLTGNRSIIGFGGDHCLTDGQGFVHAVSSLMRPVDPSQASTPTFKPPSISFGQRILYFIVSIWYTFTTIMHIVFFRSKGFNYVGPEVKKTSVAWTKPMRMEDIKIVRAANPGTTLNDVLLACLERSYTAYLDEIEKDTAVYPGRVHKRDKILNVLVPKGLRMPGDARFVNHASIEFMRLPLLNSSDTTTQQAIARAKKAMDQVKMSNYAVFMKFIINFFSFFAPGFYPLHFYRTASNNVHGIVTNIPGPTTDLCIGEGDATHRCLGFVSLSPMFPPGCSNMTITSYNGDVHFNALTYDCEAYPNMVHILMDGVYTAFQKMLEDSRKILAEKQETSEK